MKKLVFASAMALAGMCLVSAPALRAQDSSQITIQDPAEFNAYQNASTQTDPAQKAAALESFLTSYPQSVVKKAVLDQLIDTYRQLNQPAKVKDAAGRLLQVDPNNMNAIFWSVYVDKQQCSTTLDASGMSTDPQTCDDAGALAQKGLTVSRPAGMSDDDWKKMTTGAYPVFHSAIAFDDLVSKKDYAGAVKEYTAELMLYPPQATTTPGLGLQDTLQLAQAYAKPGASRDEVKAVWFYARAWDFAPAGIKPQIEQSLDYWYDSYHGMLDGQAAITQQINGIKTQAQSTLFPPAGFVITPAPSPEELANKYCAVGPDDLKKLALGDKEFILANGSQDCTTRLWAVMQGQQTPVPGVVIADPASVLKVTVTTTASVKPKDYVVKAANPVGCGAVPAPPSELKIKDAQAYILANGVKADTDAMGDVLTETPAHLRKIAIEPAISAVNVAVTQDAKDNHVADFTVNMKEPASCKEAPATGSALGLLSQGALELDGTYDTYTKTAASGTTAASAQMVLSGGILQQPKAAPAHHPAPKPSPAHHAH